MKIKIPFPTDKKYVMQFLKSYFGILDNAIVFTGEHSRNILYLFIRVNLLSARRTKTAFLKSRKRTHTPLLDSDVINVTTKKNIDNSLVFQIPAQQFLNIEYQKFISVEKHKEFIEWAELFFYLEYQKFVHKQQTQNDEFLKKATEIFMDTYGINEDMIKIDSLLRVDRRKKVKIKSWTKKLEADKKQNLF